MPDWTAGMQQTFEYYEVDPTSWKDMRRLTTVTNSSINRDAEAETLATASIDATEEFGEMYIRIYLKTIQNGIAESTPLGTFLIQTPNDKFDGSVHTFSYDAYSPLLELKDNPPPVGYFIPKGFNVMEMALTLCRENCRAPVTKADSTVTLVEDFVAEEGETWLDFLSDLIALADFEFALDDYGGILFMPIVESRALQPRAEYNDDNSSILYPDAEMKRDLYGIPNVVEVIYTSSNDTPKYIRVVNDDPNSPTSTISRGREVIHRDTSPSTNGKPTDVEMEDYANNLLSELSTLEYTVTYRHGYTPARLKEGVLLNYERAGYTDIKARIISQSISCEPGCPVDETAVYTINLWKG